MWREPMRDIRKGKTGLIRKMSWNWRGGNIKEDTLSRFVRRHSEISNKLGHLAYFLGSCNQAGRRLPTR